jgi:cold shock CspA family protein
MARSKETFSKKENKKKKEKKRQNKDERKAERRSNNNKGKSLEDMMAYLDEDGNITSTPPDQKKKKEINLEDIQLGAARRDLVEEETERTGTVTFFNEAKGFGFIKDSLSKESIFVHANGLETPIKENDRVSFETQKGQRGPVAVKVKKI